jgi:hypothetical protein
MVSSPMFQIKCAGYAYHTPSIVGYIVNNQDARIVDINDQKPLYNHYPAMKCHTHLTSSYYPWVYLTT